MLLSLPGEPVVPRARLRRCYVACQASLSFLGLAFGDVTLPARRVCRSSASPSATSAHLEPLARQPAEVVRQPDHEQPDHEREADEAGALHDAERDRPAADLLRDLPEDVPPVE